MPENKSFPNAKIASRRTVLRAEEKQLWDLVTKDVKKLSSRSPRAGVELAEAEKPMMVREPVPSQEVSEVQGWIRLETALPPLVREVQNSKSAQQMDARQKKKAQRGDLPLDGKIDLHGMTLEQAHRKFTTFLSSHIASASRFLLVVTGKGPRGEGVIRKSFPHWCEESAYARSILLLQQAAPKHGGAGAFYILLRRSK